MSAAARFSMPHISFTKKGQDEKLYQASESVPFNQENNVEITFSSEKTLIVKECDHGSAIAFPAHQEPSPSTPNFGLSILALVIIHSPPNPPVIPVIKRSSTLSTFPGALAIPGGYLTPKDSSLRGAAFRKLTDEIGDSWFGRLLSGQVVALLDSIPTPSRHNMTLIHSIHATPKEGDTLEDVLARTVALSGEVESVLFLTLAQIRERIHEFTPGLQKFFSAVDISPEGHVSRLQTE